MDTLDPTPALTAAPTPDWACPTQFDGNALREHVVAMYDRVAREPAGAEFHFHVGAAYAVQCLGYDPIALQRLPVRATHRFAGVGNPLAAGPIPAGAVVLDHACGAGTDLLLAALASGPDGRAIGVDITPAMRACAATAAQEAGLAPRVQILAGSFHALPLPDASVDVVVSNGVLNLATDKLEVMREAYRVLRPGGALYLADVTLERPLSMPARTNPALWAACVGGALTEAALADVIVRAGFCAPRIVARHDCFAGTSLPHKFGRDLAVASVTLAAERPA